MKSDDFEASIKSGITPDVEHIKIYDEIVNKTKKEGKINVKWPVIFLAATIGSYFVNYILMGGLGIVTLISIILLILNRKSISYVYKDEFLRDIYEEGLLVPGLITNLNPLTVMAIANITADGTSEVRNACYVLKLNQLPGAEGRLYEKIPCSCMFRYEGGGYHAAFQSHPLYWGTKNQEEIRAAIRELDGEQKDNYADEWEILKKISLEFPDLENEQMLLMDEHYEVLGIKYFYEDEYGPIISPKSYEDYPKQTPAAFYIQEEIPGARTYNAIIDLAIKLNVYEYIGTHCADQDLSPLTNPGFFTFPGDKELFMEALSRRKITLKEGEYPLIAGKVLLTNRGCWKKQEFTPWSEVKIIAKVSVDHEIETLVDGKCIAQFKWNESTYKDIANYSKEDKSNILMLEARRVQEFLTELKELSIKNEL